MRDSTTERQIYELHHINVSTAAAADGSWGYSIDILDPDGEWWEPSPGDGATFGSPDLAIAAGIASGMGQIDESLVRR